MPRRNSLGRVRCSPGDCLGPRSYSRRWRPGWYYSWSLPLRRSRVDRSSSGGRGDRRRASVTILCLHADGRAPGPHGRAVRRRDRLRRGRRRCDDLRRMGRRRQCHGAPAPRGGPRARRARRHPPAPRTGPALAGVLLGRAPRRRRRRPHEPPPGPRRGGPRAGPLGRHRRGHRRRPGAGRPAGGGWPPRRPGRRRRGGRARFRLRHARPGLVRGDRGQPLALPGPAPERRPGRHPLHLGHHRPTQGCGRPSLQRLHDRRRRPQLDGRRLGARQPVVHLRRHRARLHAHEARAPGRLPAPLRRRPLARGGRGRTPGGGVPRARHGAPAHRSPRFRRSRPVLGHHVLGRQTRRSPPTWSSGSRPKCPTPWSPTTTA